MEVESNMSIAIKSEDIQVLKVGNDFIYDTLKLLLDRIDLSYNI